MLYPLDVGIRVELNEAVSPTFGLQSTTLAPAPIGWRELAEVLHRGGTRYVALVLLDQGEESRKLAAEMGRRYMDLDAILGDDLVVLSTVAPPDDWFHLAHDRLLDVAFPVQSLVRDDANALRSPSGRIEAARNAATLLGEHFDGDLRPPAIVFLDFEPSVDEPGACELLGLAFSLKGLASTPDKVDGLFRDLKRHARNSRSSRKTSHEMARTAFSLWDPKSLRYKGALAKLECLLARLLGWKTKLRGLVKT